MSSSCRERVVHVPVSSDDMLRAGVGGWVDGSGHCAIFFGHNALFDVRSHTTPPSRPPRHHIDMFNTLTKYSITSVTIQLGNTYTINHTSGHLVDMGRMAEMQRKLLEVSPAGRFPRSPASVYLYSPSPALVCLHNRYRDPLFVSGITANDGSRSYGRPTHQRRLVGPESLQEFHLRDVSSRHLR